MAELQAQDLWMLRVISPLPWHERNNNFPQEDEGKEDIPRSSPNTVSVYAVQLLPMEDGHLSRRRCEGRLQTRHAPNQESRYRRDDKAIDCPESA